MADDPTEIDRRFVTTVSQVTEAATLLYIVIGSADASIPSRLLGGAYSCEPHTLSLLQFG